jgi:regulatory protein
MEIIKLKSSEQPKTAARQETTGELFDTTQESSEFKITDIRQAVKNQNRVNVFVNNEYSFSLDIAQLVDFKLKIGIELSQADISKYQHASSYGKVYQRTLEWVLSRPRSIRETQDYLRKKQFDLKKQEDQNVALEDEEVEKIISTLINKKYLNDEAYAKYYVENRFTKKGISAKRLRMELNKKGINSTIIEEVLSSGARNDEEEIKKIIAKKRNKYDDEKLTNYLLRQGFDYELVRTLIQQASCEMD